MSPTSSNRVARAIGRLAERGGAFLVDRKAATAVEFAFIAVPFFMIFCAIFESALLVFSQGNLEAATYTTSRQLLTGAAQTSTTTLTAASFRTTFCNSSVSGILATFSCSDATKMFIDVRNASDFTTNPGTADLFTTTTDVQAGGSGSVIVMRVGYKYPLYFTGGFNMFGMNWSLNSWGSSGAGTRNMIATVVFKSENY